MNTSYCSHITYNLLDLIVATKTTKSNIISKNWISDSFDKQKLQPIDSYLWDQTKISKNGDLFLNPENKKPYSFWFDNEYDKENMTPEIFESRKQIITKVIKHFKGEVPNFI